MDSDDPRAIAAKMQEARTVEMNLGDWATLHATLVAAINTATENVSLGLLPWPTTDLGRGNDRLNEMIQQGAMTAAAEILDLLAQMLDNEFGASFRRGAPRLNGVTDPRTLN